MKIRHLCCGLVVVAIAAAGSACNAPAAEEPAPAADAATAQNSAAAAREDSVVAYDSDTQGALQVMSVRDNPGDWFDVLRDGQRAFAGNPVLLNGIVELAPGAYDVSVSKTLRRVTIEAGKKTVLWTGELRVEGEPDSAWWYPMQGNERRLSSNPSTLNTSRDMFPGTYQVFVNLGVTRPQADLGDVEVAAGRTTVVTH